MPSKVRILPCPPFFRCAKKCHRGNVVSPLGAAVLVERKYSVLLAVTPSEEEGFEKILLRKEKEE